MEFKNFWGDDERRKNLVKIINTNNQSILFHSVFGNIKNIDINDKRKKIFYYGENIFGRKDYEEFSNLEHLKIYSDYIVGFKPTDLKNKLVRFPLWFLSTPYSNGKDFINYFNTKREMNLKKSKQYDFCLLSRKNGFEFQRSDVLNIVNKYLKDKTLRCPCSFGKNCSDSVGPSVQNKIDYISKFKFNICPENSSGDGYITEKIFEAFEGGCVPIYWCSDFLPEPKILNPKSYFKFNVSNSKELENNVEEIKRFVNFVNDYENVIKEPMFLSTAESELDKMFYDFKNII